MSAQLDAGTLRALINEAQSKAITHRRNGRNTDASYAGHVSDWLQAKLDEMTKEPQHAHPEAFCQRCSGRNVCWSAPNDLWNKIMPDGGIICPVCFVELAYAKGIENVWDLSPRYTSTPRIPPDLAEEK